MSIKAEGVPPDLDPCELPPSGGYRGLENQLYRIEIHDGGAVGAATFKWSRDNASVASNVTEIVSNTAIATELKLASLGRDAVLRFNTGDWVEILDDRRELGGENGDPALRRGVMRKITTINNDRQTISFSPALPADMIPAGSTDTLNARHTRVRRWDHKGKVRDAGNNIIVDLDTASGLIPVPAPGVWIALENGIQIQFGLDSPGGVFHCGDYWVAAARSADTSVETFTQAPPRGIHRHHARLSIINFPDSETDCRIHWPPACGGCCTVNVMPGENIQSAIDSLPEEGGCVCLKTGVHNLDAPLQIQASSIILRGESPGAIVRSTGLPTSLQIGNSNVAISDIVVENLRFETAAAGLNIGSILSLEHCTRVRVEHCTLAVTVTAQQAASAFVGINLSGVTDVKLIANRLDNFLIGILSGDHYGSLIITDNTIAGITGTVSGQSDAPNPCGPCGILVAPASAQACRIENNLIRHFWTGIYLGQHAAGSLIAGNRIERNAAITSDTPPTDVATMRHYLDTRRYAVDIGAEKCDVRGNRIDLFSAAWGGIRVGGTHATITANVLEATAQEGQQTVPAGIYCLADVQNDHSASADYAVVRDNQLLGAQSGIVVSRINGAVVSGNHINGRGAGWFGVRADDCTGSRIGNNDIREVFLAVYLSEGDGNRVTGNRINRTGFGISATQETNLEVTGNTLQSCLLAGVTLFVRGTTAVLNNRVFNCGYASALSIGIGVFAEEMLTPSDAHLRIEDCEVVDTGLSADGKQTTTGNAIGIGVMSPACQVGGNRVGYTHSDQLEATLEHRALLLIGPLALQYNLAAVAIDNGFGSALVSDNHFRGPGTILVEFKRIQINKNIDFRFEKVTFSNNVCDHLFQPVIGKGRTNGKTYDVTVSLLGLHLIAMGNHIKAGAGVISIEATGNKIALLGNVTTGAYVGVGGTIPTSSTDFNIQL